MPALFSVPFEELTLAHLASFLAGAEPEPLLWEAKGQTVSPHEVRRQCGGFGNSERGGFLFLGASPTPQGWALNGAEFPDGEPHRFVTSCLQEGVRPIPPYDVRSFEAASGRHVAVVKVDPLDAGPCIVRGTVYERVAGATVPVKDPGRLAELFARGRHAHERARAAADTAVGGTVQRFATLDDEPYAGDEPDDERTLFGAVGLGPILPAAGVSSRLFTETARTTMLELAGSLAPQRHPVLPSIWPEVAQDRRVVVVQSALSYEPDWVLSAWWNGAVCVGFRDVSGTGRPQRLIEDFVSPALHVTTTLARWLGATGDGYLDIRVIDSLDARWVRPVRVPRGPVELNPAAVDLASIEREFSRAAGMDAPEPEPQ